MPTLSSVGIAGVGSGIMHPKHRNRFRVLFTGMGGGASTAMPNDLSLQVITCSRPSLEFEEIQLDRYNSRAYVAGKHTFQPISMTIEDDATNRASAAIQMQLERQQRLIGATGPWLNTEHTALTYKFGMMLETLDGNETVLESWKCEGCYLASANFSEMDYSSGEKMTIELSVRVDHFRLVLTPSLTGGALGGFINV